jgi:hypothetical protein
MRPYPCFKHYPHSKIAPLRASVNPIVSSVGLDRDCDVDPVTLLDRCNQPRSDFAAARPRTTREDLHSLPRTGLNCLFVMFSGTHENCRPLPCDIIVGGKKPPGTIRPWEKTLL